MHRLPQVGPALDVQPEVRAVAEHAGEDESGRRSYGAPIVAKFIHVLARHAHSLGQGRLSQAHWPHELLDEYLAAAETPTPLRTALTRLGAKDAPSILSEERYRDAIARHPDASILHVGTSRAVVEAWFWIIESGLAGIPPIEDGESDVDLASVLRPLLPDPALVGKYLSGVTTNALEVGTQSVRMSVHAR